MNKLPLRMQPRPELPPQPDLVRPRDPRPVSVAVLEDWLGEHAPGWVVDAKRDHLETCRWGVLRDAPRALVDEAWRTTWERWEADTDPGRLLPMLAHARGRGKVGALWAEHLWAARQAHGEALLLALHPSRGILARHVRTWAVGGHYGCGSDEVRFRGAAVTVHRLGRVTEDSRQAIAWPRHCGEPPEGWWEDGHYIRRNGGSWRVA